MFWLESKNLVFQNQPETQGTCINSGKKNREFVKENLRILKVITNGWLKEKEQKRSQMGEPFLQYMCSQSLSLLLFFILQFTFQSYCSFFFNFLWLDCAETQTIWNSRWQKWTIGLKKWTVESQMRKECDWVHNFWKEPSLFVCFWFFFLQLVFFDDLVTFTNSLLHFALSIDVPCVSDWFWQTMFLVESKKLVCQKKTWYTRNLHWQWKKEYIIC